mgnify:CR=1 FL=1
MPHVTTHDGRTIRYPDPQIGAMDTIKLDLETGKPHTLTTIRVHEWMKGSGGETLVLREVGGTYAQGELHYAIDGVPDYRLGEEVVVFLDEDQGGDFYRTHEMVQGKFVVELAVALLLAGWTL